jgi:uncharacterized protein (TIGR02118 family)
MAHRAGTRQVLLGYAPWCSFPAISTINDSRFSAVLSSFLMVRLSVMYPATPGSRFNWDYYLGPHLELSRKLLTPRGLVRTEIDRGIGGLPPGAPAPYHAVGHLFFRTLPDLQSALAATAADFIADERNYTDVPSVVQISEVVE